MLNNKKRLPNFVESLVNLRKEPSFFWMPTALKLVQPSRCSPLRGRSRCKLRNNRLTISHHRCQHLHRKLHKRLLTHQLLKVTFFFSFSLIMSTYEYILVVKIIIVQIILTNLILLLKTKQVPSPQSRTKSL